MMRLDRIIASTGRYSRREVKTLLHRVTVDGQPARSADQQVNPETAVIAVDGQPIRYYATRTLMLHKPAGYVSATEDCREQTVLELLPPELRRIGLAPAGRLDKDAEGLLLLTNDGDYAHRVMAPKSGVKKRYLVLAEGTFTAEDCARFRAGVTLADGRVCLPAGLEPLGEGRAIVTLHEGKFHQVKRMCAAVGKPVRYLKRLSIGALRLDESLAPGDWKPLDEAEKELVFRDFDELT